MELDPNVLCPTKSNSEGEVRSVLCAAGAEEPPLLCTRFSKPMTDRSEMIILKKEEASINNIQLRCLDEDGAASSAEPSTLPSTVNEAIKWAMYNLYNDKTLDLAQMPNSDTVEDVVERIANVLRHRRRIHHAIRITSRTPPKCSGKYGPGI